MVDVWSALVLGLVQGLTEFLPVSSTGHLILVRDFFGLSSENGLAFDALLHLATAAAVLVYFWRDLHKLADGIKRKESSSRILFFAIVAGTIPAALAGFFLEDTMATLFRDPSLVAGGLLVGSLAFLAAERLARRNQTLNVSRGFAIGLFQALALIPGLSRSGMSISGGLLLGLTREHATRFAFLLSFPIILGAGGKKLIELLLSGTIEANLAAVIVGTIAAFIAGLAAIHFMITYLKTHTLLPFVIYRVALAALVVLLL